MVEANKHIFVNHFLGLMRSMTSSQSQLTAEDWFNKSVALHDQGNYADAIQALDEAIRLAPNDPNNAIAWNNKGLALYYQGKYDEAVKAYEEETQKAESKELMQQDDYYMAAQEMMEQVKKEMGK
jgi:tetratricopeptide (TPR) repeat protein